MFSNKLPAYCYLTLFVQGNLLCASSSLPIIHKFHEYIPLAVQEFKRKDRLSKCSRALSYGLIGIGFSIAFFRKSSFAPQEANTVSLGSHTPAPVSVIHVDPALPSSWLKSLTLACKGAMLSALGIGAGFFSWFVSERLLNTVAHGLISPLLEPVQRIMSAQRTILADDIWFLREQVRGSRSAFVLVSIDMYNFVDALKAWEFDMRTVHKLMQHAATISDNAAVMINEVYHEQIQLAQERICYQLARMIGHTKYMCSKATDFDLCILETLVPVIQRQVESAVAMWLAGCSEYHQEACLRATDLFEQSIRSTFLPLLSVSLYRIHPWPASVACSDYAQSFVTSVVASCGNPLT